jgi:two-component system, sporulation sensor kinase E
MNDEPALLSGEGIDPTLQEKQKRFLQQFANQFLTLEGIGVLLLDSEFRIVEISEMLCDIFDCNRTQAVYKPIEEWFELLSIKPPPFDRTLLQGATFRNRLLKWTVHGQDRELTLDGEVLKDNDVVLGAFILLKDVTHLMTLEEQIRRSDRLKTIGQIAAGTAHEIRNPLTAIKGFMQLLSKTLADRQMSKELEYVRIVQSELDRVNDLVSEFLLLSKPKEIKLKVLRIGLVLQEILPMIRNEALLHKVVVLYYPIENLPPILADKELLKQVFLNLGKNAIEAMSGGGTLIIRERIQLGQTQRIAVEICDTGMGIPGSELDKVFEPFFTTKAQGTGLGLSVCQRIVHDLGGSIDVTSSESGSQFRVWLPHVAEDPIQEINKFGGERSPDDV